MQKASDALEFEKAAALLLTMKQIEHITQGGGIVAKASGKDCDALALHRQGGEVMLSPTLFPRRKTDRL